MIKDVSLLKEVTSEPPIHSIRIIWHNTTNTLHFSTECFVGKRHPVTRRFAVIPSIYGRILIGRDFPYPLQNAIGGEVPGFYIPQQLPFAGVTNLELMDNTIMIASIKFRQRMGAIHYLTLTGNYGLTDSNFFDILKGKQLFGSVPAMEWIVSSDRWKYH